MDEVSEKEWNVLRLASVAIARNSMALEQLSESLTKQYTDSEIASIWRRARIVLTEEDKCWLENELYCILLQASEATA